MNRITSPRTLWAMLCPCARIRQTYRNVHDGATIVAIQDSGAALLRPRVAINGRRAQKERSMQGKPHAAALPSDVLTQVVQKAARDAIAWTNNLKQRFCFKETPDA